MSSEASAAVPRSESVTIEKPARWVWMLFLIGAAILIFSTSHSEITDVVRRGWASASSEVKSWLPEKSRRVEADCMSPILLTLPEGEGLEVPLGTKEWSELYQQGDSLTLDITVWPNDGCQMLVGGREVFLPPGPSDGSMRRNAPLAGPFRLRAVEPGQIATLTVHR